MDYQSQAGIALAGFTAPLFVEASSGCPLRQREGSTTADAYGKWLLFRLLKLSFQVTGRSLGKADRISQAATSKMRTQLRYMPNSWAALIA